MFQPAYEYAPPVYSLDPGSHSGPSPPSPQRYVPSFLLQEKFSIFFFPRIPHSEYHYTSSNYGAYYLYASCHIVRTHVRTYIVPGRYVPEYIISTSDTRLYYLDSTCLHFYRENKSSAFSSLVDSRQNAQSEAGERKIETKIDRSSCEISHCTAGCSC